MRYLVTLVTGALSGEGAGTPASTVSIDFTDMLITSLDSIAGDFGKYAMVAGATALAIWGAPKAIMMVKKFFTALSR